MSKEAHSDSETSDISDITPLANASMTSSTPLVKKNKRKASPLFKTVTKRASESRNASNISSAGNASISSPDLINALNDPGVLSSLSPLIHSMVAPVIEKAIENAVSAAVGRIQLDIMGPLLQSNSKLQETVDSQSAVITKQGEMLDEQMLIINEKSKNVVELESKVKSLETAVQSLQVVTNDTQQYSRRNSLRIDNFKADISLTEADLSKQVLSFINGAVKDSNPLTPSDIDRCHPVGRSAPGKFPQIIIKFSNYASKKRVFASKANLRNHHGSIYINEDLTRQNYRVMGTLRWLKKKKQIHSFWSRNGKSHTKKKNRVHL